MATSPAPVFSVDEDLLFGSRFLGAFPPVVFFPDCWVRAMIGMSKEGKRQGKRCGAQFGPHGVYIRHRSNFTVTNKMLWADNLTTKPRVNDAARKIATSRLPGLMRCS